MVENRANWMYGAQNCRIMCGVALGTNSWHIPGLICAVDQSTNGRHMRE